MGSSEAGDRPSLPSTASGGPLSYAIVRAGKAHRATAAALLRPIGLHTGQELLLMQLAERDHQTQTELVRVLGIDASTVTRMVARMHDQGLVHRSASATDGRAVIVSLTDQGRETWAKVRRIWAELEERTLAALGDEIDPGSVAAVLNRLADGLTIRDS